MSDVESLHDILDSVDAHLQSADHKSTASEYVATKFLAKMNALWRVDPKAAEWAAYYWQEQHRADMPFVDIVQENIRESARFWAKTASPAELECYLFAAVDELRGGLFASRQVKRMIGGLWRRMTQDEKREFLEWINKYEFEEQA